MSGVLAALLGSRPSAVAGGPAMELIETVSLANSTTATITFASIPQTYKHLQIRSIAKNSSGTNTTVNINLFGISNTYATHALSGSGSSVASGNSVANTGTSFPLSIRSDFTTVANAFTGSIIDILDYTSTTKNKTVRALYGRTEATLNLIILGSAFFINTSAISTIVFTAGNNAFQTGTRFSLYGIKG